MLSARGRNAKQRKAHNSWKGKKFSNSQTGKPLREGDSRGILEKGETETTRGNAVHTEGAVNVRFCLLCL